jgi:hypothetical protein
MYTKIFTKLLIFFRKLIFFPLQIILSSGSAFSPSSHIEITLSNIISLKYNIFSHCRRPILIVSCLPIELQWVTVSLPKILESTEVLFVRLDRSQLSCFLRSQEVKTLGWAHPVPSIDMIDHKMMMKMVGAVFAHDTIFGYMQKFWLYARRPNAPGRGISKTLGMLFSRTKTNHTTNAISKLIKICLWGRCTCKRSARVVLWVWGM